MGYFPFFMEIAGKQGVIAGGGKVAARKVEKLLAFHPVLTVIAPKIEACMWEQRRHLEAHGETLLHICERPFALSDLYGADFVIAATDDTEVNSSISNYCRENKIPVNVVDDKEKCTFFFPALIKQGAFTVGISTDGKSPIAAAWAKNCMEQVLPEGLGEIIDLLGQIRPEVMEAIPDEAKRKEVLTQMFYYCLEKNSPEKKEMQKDRNVTLTIEELRSFYTGSRSEGFF